MVNDPVEMYLSLKKGSEYWPKAKQFKDEYHANVLFYLPLMRLMTVEVPLKNARRLVEDKCVESYNFPREVEM